MKTLTSLIILLISSAYAQRNDTTEIKREIRNLAKDIQDELRYTDANHRELLRVQRSLDSSLRILLGEDTNEENTQLVCISRDNDGRSPWVIAKRNLDNLKVTRINGTTLSSKDDCKKVIENIREYRETKFFCKARDNDGRSPWQIALLKEGSNRPINFSADSGSLDDCFQSLRNLRINRRGYIHTCVSRDNDGRSPWVVSSYNLKTEERHRGREIYNTKQDCLNNL